MEKQMMSRRLRKDDKKVISLERALHKSSLIHHERIESGQSDLELFRLNGFGSKFRALTKKIAAGTVRVPECGCIHLHNLTLIRLVHLLGI